MLRYLLLADAIPPADATLSGAIATCVAALVVALVRYFAKEKAEERLKTLTSLANAIYVITAEVARKTPSKVDDKAAFALELFRRALEDRGAPPLTPAEQSRAELYWRAVHSEENLQRLPPGGLKGAASSP